MLAISSLLTKTVSEYEYWELIKTKQCGGNAMEVTEDI
jgi:hypothetical protein